MTPLLARMPAWRNVFYGNSFVDDTDAGTTTELTMQGRGVPWNTRAIAGYSWSQLDAIATTQLHPWLLLAPNVILTMVGGHAGYTLGATGAAVMASMTDIATDAEAAGANVIVINSTTTKSINFGADTTVAAGSNGVNTNTFTGSGVLNVASTTNGSDPIGVLNVATGGTTANITYTGLTGTTFTGCTTNSGGGVMSTGGLVEDFRYQYCRDGNALLLAQAGIPPFDYVVDLAADSALAADIAANDGVHPGAAGRQIIANLLAVPLDLVLPTPA